MNYLSIFILGALLMSSCKIKPNDASTITKADEVMNVQDTLLFKSTASVDSVGFIMLRANPNTTLVSMADSVIPNINDSTIALCVEAAFTGELLKEFNTTNVAGDYVIDGRFRKGYKCRANTGFLCTVNGRPFIASSDKCKEWIAKAVEPKETLFQQILLVENGKNVYRGTPIKPTAKNIYRSACILNDGNFAVIQSLTALSLEQFINSLIQLGVSDALYLDMGRGWNYGWYRETSENPATCLFDYRIPYQTNWLLIKAKK